VSVCLPQVGVLLKRLNAGSRKQRHTIAKDSSFPVPKILTKLNGGHLQRRRQIELGLVKCSWGRRKLATFDVKLRCGCGATGFSSTHPRRRSSGVRRVVVSVIYSSWRRPHISRYICTWPGNLPWLRRVHEDACFEDRVELLCYTPSAPQYTSVGF